MAVSIKLPTPLRRHTQQAKVVEVQASTVGEALQNLAARYAGLADALYGADGALKPFVRVFVGGRDIVDLQGPDTPVADGETISIVPPIAGA